MRKRKWLHGTTTKYDEIYNEAISRHANMVTRL